MLQISRRSRINLWLAKRDRWIPAVFFCCVTGLYMTMLVNSFFVDELDVFYGGYNIIRSGDLYRFYPSQHMPISYYFAAFGTLLGARTMSQYRLFFYVMMSVLWTIIYIRNRGCFSRLALLVLPLFYVVQLRIYDLGTMMISDHWQGIGILMILLEMVRYAEDQKISIRMAGMVALGIVLSFGTTFLSAYPLLIVFLGVAVMQIVQIVKKERKLSELLREDGQLALICLSPFLLLVFWYTISGNLGNAFGGAYDLNVRVYSKYLNGFGTSASRAFLSVFPNWIGYQAKSLTYFHTGEWQKVLQIWMQTTALIVYTVNLWKNKKRIVGIAFPLAVILAGIRGFDEFHGAPYMAATCVPIAFCLDGALSFFLQKKNGIRAVPAAIAMVCTLALITPEITMVKNLIHVPRMMGERQYTGGNRDLLDVIAEPEERIHTDDLSYSSLAVMRLGLKLDEASLGAGNPWFYEYYGERELNCLKENKTSIVVMEPNGAVWGYIQRDYAADLVSYIEENYTYLGMRLYIRNEDYPAVREKLRKAGYGTKYTESCSNENRELGPQIEDGKTYDQQIEAEERQLTAVWIHTATYRNLNRTGMIVQLIDNTGKVISESKLPSKEIKDDGDTRFALQAETEPGKHYTIRIMTDNTTPEGMDSCLHLYICRNDRPESAGAVQNGEKQNFDWAVLVEYDTD